MSAARALLVGLDGAAAALIEDGATLAGGLHTVVVAEADAVRTAAADPPAAAVISDRVSDPLRVAQAIAAADRDTAIVLLCAPDRLDSARDALRFAPNITPNTSWRATDDLEQLGVDLVEAAQAALRRREHRLSLAAADRRLQSAPPPPRLTGEALGTLADVAPVGIVTLDGSGAVTAWNARAADVFELPEREVLGRAFAELFDAEDRPVLSGALEDGAGPVVARRHRRGAEQVLELSASRFVSEWGDDARLVVVSDITARVVADRARRRAEDAQAFLAETGALLDASLDTVETLQRIAALAVPARAELCLIDVLGEDGAIRGVAFAAVDPDVADAVEDIRSRYPVEADGEHPVARVIASARAELLEEMTDATYRRIAQSDEHLELMRRLHYRSALVAPLVARGRTFGAISLLHLDPGSRYTPDDLGVLEDVARRCALALDNARLYARERRVAETLQRSLLPARLPEVPGLTLAAHYEPGDGDVGGDWYDVIALDDGRVACVVGDIVGRGISAASVMGQLRNAVRVYAVERDSSDEIVRALDRLSDSLGIDQMATLCVLILDVAAGSFEICCAGHPPPLLVAPGGASRFVMSGRSGPVGVGLAARHAAATEPLEPGSTLVMYTDGLIERRGIPLDVGLEALDAAIGAAPTGDPASLAATVMGALRPAGAADDVALLVIGVDPVGDGLRLSFAADPASIRTVRAELARWLEGRLPAEAIYDVVLACSEACANAVEHAYAIRRGRVEVEGTVDGEALQIVIRDFGRWRTPGASRRGRGTSIMQAVMDAVDVRSADPGTEVVLRRTLPS